MSDSNRRPLILHISSDYPDPFRPPTTDAVRRLVDRMTDHPQIVVSLQRLNDPRREYWHDLGSVDGRRHIACGYFAPPWGIGMLACQALLARRIRAFLSAEGLAPSVVHAHRFTFEGIGAWLVARRTRAALFFSVRGEVESKVFSAKPTYRPLFRRMARDAARVYFVSAWFRERFCRHTGLDPARTHLLPNIVMNARAVIEPVLPERRIACVMTLRAIDRKGLPELLAAFARAGSALDGITLEIIGDGPEEAFARARMLIDSNELTSRVALRGPMQHEALLGHLGGALGMALPSHNETFGMVYPEALFAGTPILYGAGTGIDGYLDGLDVGVAVVPGDVDSIAGGLVALVGDNARLRAGIRNGGRQLFARFDPDTVMERYRADAAEIPARPGRQASGQAGLIT